MDFRNLLCCLLQHKQPEETESVAKTTVFWTQTQNKTKNVPVDSGIVSIASADEDSSRTCLKWANMQRLGWFVQVQFDFFKFSYWYASELPRLFISSPSEATQSMKQLPIGFLCVICGRSHPWTAVGSGIFILSRLCSVRRCSNILKSTMLSISSYCSHINKHQLCFMPEITPIIHARHHGG